MTYTATTQPDWLNFGREGGLGRRNDPSRYHFTLGRSATLESTDIGGTSEPVRLAGPERETLRDANRRALGRTHVVVACDVLDAVLNAFDTVEWERDAWRERCYLAGDARETARKDLGAILEQLPPTLSGLSPVEHAIDLIRVATSFLERVETVTKSGPFKGWAPADDPAEIVIDLVDTLEDAIVDRDEANALIAEALPACRFVNDLASLPDAVVEGPPVETWTNAVREAARTLNGGFGDYGEAIRERDFLREDRDACAAQAKAVICSLVDVERYDDITSDQLRGVLSAFERGERYAPRYSDAQREAASTMLRLIVLRGQLANPNSYAGTSTDGERYGDTVDAVAQALGMRRAGS